MADKVEFAVPDGFTIPETDKEDGSFRVVCTLRPKDGGKMLCITKLGDVDMPGYGGKESDNDEDDKVKKTKSESKPSYGDYASSLIGGMDNPGAGAATGSSGY